MWWIHWYRFAIVEIKWKIYTSSAINPAFNISLAAFAVMTISFHASPMQWNHTIIAKRFADFAPFDQIESSRYKVSPFPFSFVLRCTSPLSQTLLATAASAVWAAPILLSIENCKLLADNRFTSSWLSSFACSITLLSLIRR